MKNPISCLTEAIFHVIQSEPIRRIRITTLGQEVIDKEIINIDELDIVMFSQSWPSTALGFGGIGGSAITWAYTIVIHLPHNTESLIYFDGKFAYKVENNNCIYFQDDLQRFDIKSVKDSIVYSK